jgi:hypothetical protein
MLTYGAKIIRTIPTATSTRTAAIEASYAGRWKAGLSLSDDCSISSLELEGSSFKITHFNR